MWTAIVLIGITAVYAAIMSTISFRKIKTGGQITEDSVVSPSGKKIIEKSER